MPRSQLILKPEDAQTLNDLLGTEAILFGIFPCILPQAQAPAPLHSHDFFVGTQPDCILPRHPTTLSLSHPFTLYLDQKGLVG
ncbi:MAG: hypothetical protein HC812_20310 [Leptolyngbya sp. RL_3_1]|nr:hypothetical protein [Leptolyngbya sp. RL_3_1]